MRDYPSVPNVFRVASSHSVDTDTVVAIGGGSDIKTPNANLSAGQLRHHKQKQQQQNGSISGQQQPLVKSSVSSAAITTGPALSHISVTTVSVTTAPTTTKATATSSLAAAPAPAPVPASTSSSTILRTFAAKHDAGDSIMHNHSSQQQQQQRQQQYKLTTHASIERPQCLRASQLYLQSPYATLPRNTTSTSQSSLSLHSANGDIYAQQHLQQQQHFQQHLQQQPQPTIRHHNSTNSSNSNGKHNHPTGSGTGVASTNTATTGATTTAVAATTVATSNGNNSKHSSENNKGNTNDSTMMGVINTISGSIPATGFPMDHATATTNNVNANASTNSPGMVHVSVNGRTMSVASDLNASMNNSCTNLSKLNGLPHHQQQQQQHHQKQQQQQQQQQRHHQQQQQQKLQSTTTQQRDFRQVATTARAGSTMDEFTPYRRTAVHPCSSLERNNSGYLWIITPVAASISVAIVIAALAGPQWLFTEEKQPNTNYNGTANFNVLDDGAFITRYTKSSLWIICSTVQGVETYSCIKIDYFSKEGYHPDPHDSASAIPYTVTKSCPFFLASGIVLLLSFIVFLIPTCSHQNNLYYFSAGIMFIVSGLLMLIGLIAYISILKAEIGSKLRPRSSLQPPMFKVTYGQSFFLFVFGFIATEFVGLLNIFLYISLQEVGYYSRLPCFTISNLQEKIKEGENRHNYHKKNTYKSFKHEIDKKPIDRKRQQQNKKHQVRAQELELDTKKLLKNMSQMGRVEAAAAAASGRRVVAEMLDKNAEAPYACRKHPNGMGSSTMYLNELERRYYFEKTSGQLPNKCNLHSKNLAKSLNELYLESTLPPPPPSAIRMGAGLQLQQHQQQRLHQQQQQQHQRQQYQQQIQTLPRPPQQFSDAPQEFPLTRSVSTTTEIYATQNVSFGGGGAGNLSEKSTANRTPLQEQKYNSSSNTNANNRRRNVATNTRYNTDTETQTNAAGGGGGNQQHNTKKFLQQQHQQQLENLYNKRQQQHYATATTASSSTARSGGKPDRHQQFDEHHRAHHHDDVDENENDDDDMDGHGEEDENDADEEQPQKLCGLKRGIRKTKDELFEEFCKRAGVRPKPKNIYYIENDDDADAPAIDDEDEGMPHKVLRSKNNIRNAATMSNNGSTQPHHQRPAAEAQRKLHGKMSEFRVGNGIGGNSSSTLENNRIFVGGNVLDMDAVEGVEVCLNGVAAPNIDDGDDDVDMLRGGGVGEGDDDEHGFKKLTENEDHLYVIDDNIHLMPQSAAIRNGRRASMYVEPNHMRRLNSNLSLHALYAPLPVQKGLYDFETISNDYAFPATASAHPAAHYMTRDVYGGSQNRLHHDYRGQQPMYQSRTTLPRALVKRNADSQDSIASVSATQLHNIYSASQQRLSTLMMQQQQQQQLQHQHQQQQQQQHLQQNRYLTISREQELYNSRYGLHKSNEELNRHYVQQSIYLQPHHQVQYQQQQQQQQHQQHQQHQQQQQHPHVAATLKQPLVQWPAAIPSSPSNFSASYHMYGGPAVVSSQNSNHAVLTRSQSGGGNGTAGGNGTGPSKFQRAYAFDEQRRPSAMVTDAFDLDEIERERRRSHASLFAGVGVNGSHVVKTNGTGVAAGIGGGVGDGGGGGGVAGPQKASNNNRDHYDMINGTAV